MNSNSADPHQNKPAAKKSVPKTSETELASAQDSLVYHNLAQVTLGLGLLFAILSAAYILLLTQAYANLLAVVSAVTSGVMLIIQSLLSRKRIPLQRVQPLAAGLAGLVLANSLLQIYLTAEPWQTIHLLLLVAAAGYLMLSDRWFALVIAFAILGWVAIARLSGPSPLWLYFGFGLLAAAILSMLFHLRLMRLASQIDGLRLQDARRKAELEEVLISTESAQRSLATSIAVGQRITSILDLDVLLNQVAGLIRERFSCNYVGIFLLDDSEEYLVARAGAGTEGRNLHQDDIRFKIGDEGVIGWVAGKRRPLYLPDVSRDSRYIQLESPQDTRSELALPLEMGRTLLGVLDMQNESLAAFQEDDIPFMQLLADQVAIAIQNASLYQTEKLRRRLAETLYGVGRALSGTLNPAEVLDLILEQLEQIVHSDRASVLLHSDTADELEMAASRGFPAGAQKLRISIKENDVFQEIYRTQQPLHLPDVSLRIDWQHAENLPVTRAWLGIPLIRSDEVIGMLSLARVTLEPYTQDEIALASTFAGQAAIALQNARLYAQIKRFNQNLELMVQERTEELQEAYNRLYKLDKTKSDFISIASHELRTPITVIQGYTQMLLENASPSQSGLHQQIVSGIHTGVQRMGEIVSSFLDAAKIDNQAFHLYPSMVTISTLVDVTCKGFSKSVADRNLSLSIEKLDSLPPIQADPEALQKVFYHLIQNAIKYTPNEGSIKISGNLVPEIPGKPGKGGIEVLICDTGIGIDPGLRELIFEKFFQTGEVSLHSTGKTKFKGGGPGLGLAIAKGIVEAHGGKIWVESPGYDEKTCPGSQFHVLLPRLQ